MGKEKKKLRKKKLRKKQYNFSTMAIAVEKFLGLSLDYPIDFSKRGK